MKLDLLLLLGLIRIVFAADATTPTTTLVWATGTDANGQTTVTQSPFTQSFTSLFTDVPKPSSGSIGLGSISGEIGKVRSYSQTTVHNSASSVFNPIQATKALTNSWALVVLLVASFLYVGVFF